MDKLSTILFLVWIGLAIASFVSGFFIPLIPKIINLVFGSVNLLVIGAWVATTIIGKRNARKARKIIEEAQEK